MRLDLVLRLTSISRSNRLMINVRVQYSVAPTVSKRESNKSVCYRCAKSRLKKTNLKLYFVSDETERFYQMLSPSFMPRAHVLFPCVQKNTFNHLKDTKCRFSYKEQKQANYLKCYTRRLRLNQTDRRANMQSSRSVYSAGLTVWFL